MPGPYSATNPPPGYNPAPIFGQPYNSFGGPLGTAYAREAERLRGLEEGDRSEAIGLSRAAFSSIPAEAMTDADTNRMFSGMAARSGRESLELQRQARQTFADQGIVGGGAQTAMGMDIGLRRYGQLLDARAGTKNLQMQENMAHKFRRLGAATGVGQTIMSPRSAVGLDAIGDLLGLNAQMSSDRMARDEARAARKDANRNALIGAGVNAATGLLGLV